VKLEGAHSEVFTSCRLIVCYCFGRVVARRHAFPPLVNYRGEREPFGCPKVLERLPDLTAQLPDNLTVPSVGAMNVWTAPWSTVMQLKTTYLRLGTAVTLGSRFGDWRVCWLGGWSRHRLFYLVMLVRVEPLR